MKSTAANHVGAVHSSESHVKHHEAAVLAADVAAFVAAGGVIEVLGNTPFRNLEAPKRGRKSDPALTKRHKPKAAETEDAPCEA